MDRASRVQPTTSNKRPNTCAKELGGSVGNGVCNANNDTRASPLAANMDVVQEVIAFTGGQNFVFVAAVSRLWLGACGTGP